MMKQRGEEFWRKALLHKSRPGHKLDFSIGIVILRLLQCAFSALIALCPIMLNQYS